MVSNPRGLFISFEGIDGAGKTTHIESVARLFEAQGRTVVRTREPGGTPLAEQLRERVLNDEMDALTEALLVFAARRDHIQRVISPALAQGHVVLSDRFTDATFAYQGAGRGFDLSTLSTLESWVQAQEGKGVLQPDLTLWFELPATVAAQRLSKARVADRFEQQDVAFFERVAQGYAQRHANAPERIARINANQERHQVWQQITHRLVQKGWLAIMVANNFKLTS
jgi:dTMP kinase